MPLDRDLRSMFRPLMGTPVTFAGVSIYVDDGTPVCGMFNRPSSNKPRDGDFAGTAVAMPELELPNNAVSPLPDSGDAVTVHGENGDTDYQVNAPEAASTARCWHTNCEDRVTAPAAQSIQSNILALAVAALPVRSAAFPRLRGYRAARTQRGPGGQRPQIQQHQRH